MKRPGDAYTEVASTTAHSAAGDFSHHFKLVKRIAAHFRGRLPAAIEHSDLIQAGIVGLMEAIEAFDETRGNDFETFAKLRIRGAMLDEIRRAAWAPRSTVKVAVEARAAATRIANANGGAATNRQIAEQLGIDVDRYEKLRGRNQGLVSSVTLEDIDIAQRKAESDINLAIKEIETKIEASKKKRKKFEDEAEFYKKNTMPAEVTKGLGEADHEIKTQQELLAVKRGDLQTIKTKYDTDRKRYIELTGARPRASR